MKRLMLLLLAVSAALSVCACSNPLKTASEVTTSALESTTDTTVILEDPSVPPSFVFYNPDDNTQIALTLEPIYADWHYTDTDGNTVSVTEDNTASYAAADAAAGTTEEAASDVSDASGDSAAQEAAAEDTAAEETAAEDTAAEETTAEETAAEDTAAEGTASEEAAAQETASGDAADTQTAEDTAAQTDVASTETVTAVIAASSVSLPTLDVDDDSEIYYLIDTGATPDQLEETSWKAEYIGSESADAMEIYTQLANFNSLPLKADRVYQIVLTWYEENFETVGYYGTLTYMFVTD